MPTVSTPPAEHAISADWSDWQRRRLPAVDADEPRLVARVDWSLDEVDRPGFEVGPVDERP
jgi:hypothetical protein